jgi:hypothetical protein
MRGNFNLCRKLTIHEINDVVLLLIVQNFGKSSRFLPSEYSTNFLSNVINYFNRDKVAYKIKKVG